jgi:L-threonylcarbamoyladenylate synthase
VSAASPPTLRVKGQHPEPPLLERALLQLAAGQLLIYPTDTLYALGGLARDPEVSIRIRRAKGREEGKGLPLIASDAAQARSLCASWPARAAALADRFWPGPLTLVLPSRETLPATLTAGLGTVAVRVPALALARALCAHGPLVSTSANRSGGPAPSTCAEAVRAVGKAAALALDAGTLGGAPSTIVSLVGPEPELLRQGAIAWAEVRRALR